MPRGSDLLREQLIKDVETNLNFSILLLLGLLH